MVYKLIDATNAKPGVMIMINNEPCIVKSMDVSKTGKHGASKARIEAIGVIDDKKRITVSPGSERFEVPEIDKRRGQVLSVSEKTASIMDMESFETLDVAFAEDVKEQIINGKEGLQVEYWVIDGRKIIKRIV